MALSALPLIYTSYFFFGVTIFNFGQVIPFTFFSEEKVSLYENLLIIVVLHFAIVAVSLRLAPRFRRLFAFTIRRPTSDLGILFFFASLAPALFLLLSLNPSELISRESFVPYSLQGHIMRFADITFWISAVTVPFLKSPWQRFGALAVVSILFTLLGSRSGPVMVIIYVAINTMILRRRNLMLHSSLVCLASYILAVSIATRSTNSGGGVAMLYTAQNLSWEELTNFVSLSLNYMTTFSIVMSSEVAYFVDAEPQWFWYSILPLPSTVYDLSSSYDTANRFRTNIPYPGLGYAISFLGPMGYLAAVFASSLLFASLRNLLSTRRDIIEQSLLLAFLQLPFLILTQYNLRTGSRLIYVMAFIYFAVAVGRRIKLKRQH